VIKAPPIDITPLIMPEMAVFPGCTPFSRKVELNISDGDSVTVSSIQSTVHLGAHADAPNHYHVNGQAIHERSLDHYIGPVQVIELCIPRGQRIKKSDLKVDILEKRVLFKTLSYPDPYAWSDDFNGIDPEVIDYLGEHGVITIGIDTPSVDLANDSELLSHNRIYKNDIAIIEGVVLNEVDAGVYTLIALPLKIKGADASPIRAVLLPKEQHEA
jgi:arylformamidase